MNHQDELPLAEVSEIDEAKRQWLQGMRHPVDTVTEPEPAEILAGFIRQHSAAGQLVARAVFLSPPYSVAEEELSVLLESIKQNGDYADIACMTGSQDDYYYSTQAMSENYAAMSLQVVEQDICRAIAHAVRFECQTYPRPYKVAMLMQAPYYFQEAQIEAAIAAMDVAPEYADIRQVESSGSLKCSKRMMVSFIDSMSKSPKREPVYRNNVFRHFLFFISFTRRLVFWQR